MGPLMKRGKKKMLILFDVTCSRTGVKKFLRVTAVQGQSLLTSTLASLQRRYD